MKKYFVNVPNADGELEKVAVSKEVFDFLEKDRRRTMNEERRDRRYLLYFDLETWYNCEPLSCPSVEDDFFRNFEKGKKSEFLKMVDSVLETCTEKQQRRFRLYFENKLTYEEIADLEKVCHVSVLQSIKAVIKKICKFLKKIS